MASLAPPAFAGSVQQVRVAAQQCELAARSVPRGDVAFWCGRAKAAHDAYLAEITARSPEPGLAETARRSVAAERAVIEQALSQPATPAPTARREPVRTVQAALPRAEVERRRAAAAEKGAAYAGSAGVAFSFTVERNELTERQDPVVRSAQENGQGVHADITGACAPGGAVFTVLLTDAKGKPSIRLADRERRNGPVRAQLRVDERPVQAASLAPGKFSNELVLARVLDGAKPGAVSRAENWRMLVELETNHGKIVLKLPLWDPGVARLMESCGDRARS